MTAETDAAGMSEREELSALVYQDLPGDPDRWLCDMIADHILGAGYHREAARRPDDGWKAVVAKWRNDYDALAIEVQAWRYCARYDAMMEGPKFKGWDRSALDRCRKEYIEKRLSQQRPERE